MPQKILILAANPKGTTPLRLDEEVREIYAGLQRAKQRDQFVLEQKWAVRPRDIQRAMLDINPQIIHFCGHGTGDEGLVFEDETGSAKLVDGETLARLFELFAEQIECIVLNGCYSEVQANAIAQHINYVIGMSKAIGDKAAIEFAVGFYDALGAGLTVEFAHKFGCAAIRLAGIPKNLTPVLKARQRLIKTKIQTTSLTVISVKSSVDDSTSDDNKSTQNRSVNTYTFWAKGKYVIAFASGGAFLGSLSSYTFISVIGALIGGVYGLVFNKASNSNLNNNLFHKRITPKKLFQRGEYMIALASGGAFLGGIIAQLPGSIIGALVGAIFSLFTIDNRI